MPNESHHQDIRNRISFIMPDGEYYDSHYLGVQTDYEEAGGGALSRMSSFVAKKLSPKPQQKVSSLSSSNTILLSKR